MRERTVNAAVAAATVAALAGLGLSAGTAASQAPLSPPTASQGFQPAAPPAAPAQGGGRGRGPATFPAQQRPPGDPAIIARGQALYGVSCRSCHGADLRGGDMGGSNLLRSQQVLNDQDGELILPVIRGGRQNPGMPVMPALDLPADDIKAIATYIRGVLASASPQGGPPPGPSVVLNVRVGDPAAGRAYFESRCSACHSPAADLQGIGARVPEAMQLQNLWVAGGRGGRGGPPTGTGTTPSRREVTVSVTMPGGASIDGRLERIDDFTVVLTEADGARRSIRRDGNVPAVVIRDPLETHRKLLLVYTDKDIHDVTAYLSTIK